MSEQISEPQYTETDFGESGYEQPGYEPASEQEWSGPSADEWSQTRDAVALLAQQFAENQDYAAAEAQHADEQALHDLLDPYSETYDPQQAAQILADAAAQQVQPVLEWQAEQQAEQAHNAAVDEAYATIEQYGIADEAEQEAIYDAAEQSIEEAIAQVGVKNVHELARWAAAQLGEDPREISRRIGLIALEQAVANYQRSQQSSRLDEVGIAKRLTSGPISQHSPSGGNELSVAAHFNR
jgi:hypothetical protein